MSNVSNSYLLSARLDPRLGALRESKWRLDVEPGDRSPRRRRGPGRGGDERAPERLRRAAPRRGAPSDRRAVALGAVGFPGRQRTRLARPVPRPRVRRHRPRWFRLEGAGRGLLRRLRGEDRGADPLRRRGDVGAQERRPARLPRGDLGRGHRCALRRRRDWPVPAAGDPGDHSRQRRALEHPLQLVPQPAATARRRRPRRRGRVIGGADRRRAPEVGPTGLPLRRPARPAAAKVPRARLRLVARGPRQVGGRNPSPGRGARHYRGQRRARRPHGRLPHPGRQRHQAHRPGRFLRQRNHALRAGPRRQHRARRRQLPVAARGGRRLCRAQRPRSPRGAGRSPPGPRPGLRDQPRPRTRPRPGRRHLGRLGDRLHRRLRLAERRRVRRRTASRSTSAACRPSPASTSWACPGSHGADRASSGGSGTTPSTSPTTSRCSGGYHAYGSAEVSPSDAVVYGR